MNPKADFREIGWLALARLWPAWYTERRDRDNGRKGAEAMESLYSFKLGKLIEEFHLEVLRGADGFEDCAIRTEDINRPGLQLAGFFDYFDPKRLQIIGRVETAYLDGLTPEERRARFDRLLEYNIPALLFARGIEPFPECMEMAEKYNRTILRSKETTSALMSAIIGAMQIYLAPRITRHGVLVEVYGEGVFLMGESGVGKSETAIELVQRGHRLISDDAVEIKCLPGKRLVGNPPELIRHYIELRGIGVVNVRRIFGVGAIKEESDIDLVINIEPWKDGATYNHTGLEDFYTTILGVQIPSLTVPIKPGRNLAVIIEVDAINNRNKKMGYNSAEEFARQIDAYFDLAMGEQSQPQPKAQRREQLSERF